MLAVLFAVQAKNALFFSTTTPVQLVSDLLLSHVIEGCSLASFPSGFHPPSLDPFSSIVPSVVPISEFIPRIVWVWWCDVEEQDQPWNARLASVPAPQA